MAVNVKVANVANGAQKVPVGRKPAQKKVTVKPKPEEIIEISPDTREKLMEKKMLRKKQAAEDITKKKSTLTSTLTARSKVQYASFVNCGTLSIYRGLFCVLHNCQLYN